jgi:hypothetical protein
MQKGQEKVMKRSRKNKIAPRTGQFRKMHWQYMTKDILSKVCLFYTPEYSFPLLFQFQPPFAVESKDIWAKEQLYGIFTAPCWSGR